MKQEFPDFPLSPTETFPYVLEEKIGEGAMGSVFRALEPSLERRVALKVINPKFLASLNETSATEMNQRFLQEARALARLNHPNVVTVFRVGSESGVPFMAMEWVDAKSLDEILKVRGQLEVAPAARIALKVLRALEAAHAAQIIHRDVKPGNITVEANGDVKLLDFGIAQVRGQWDGMSLTQPGMAMGTPLYAAPEQLIGNAVDARTDIYGLTAVFYEMLTGRPPYTGFKSITGLLNAHHSERPTPAIELNPEVPLELSQLLDRSLSFMPDDRPASASIMIEELRASFRGTHYSGANSAVTQRARPQQLPDVPVVQVDAHSRVGAVTELIQSWPKQSVSRIDKQKLIRDLTEPPLHAEPFSGAARIQDTWMLFHDGLVYAIFDESGDLGDELFERLPAIVDAQIFKTTQFQRALPLFAASLKDVSNAPVYESDVADLVALQARLMSEGFDGVMRICSANRMVLAFFHRGERVLDVVGGQFGEADKNVRWETWIATQPGRAYIETRENKFPALTYRHQLKSAALRVVRPERDAESILEDRVAEAQSIELEPIEANAGRGELTTRQLIHSDPVFEVMRYLIGELPLEMEQHRRFKNWRRLLEPFAQVEHVKLHHGQPVSGGRTEEFDGVTFSAGGQIHHLLAYMAVATEASVEAVIQAALDASLQSEGKTLCGAVIVAKRFEEKALEAWGSLQKKHTGSFLRAALGTFSHAEGVFTNSQGVPIHILLVEWTESGKFRPLMPA